MASAILLVIVFLTILVSRLLFASLHRPLVRETVALGQQRNNILEQALHIARAGLRVADSHIENVSDRGSSEEEEQLAETYLRRVVTLTGARQMGNSYVLDVATVRFRVRDGYVTRVQDGAAPTWARSETCFHSAYHGMSKAEQIAGVLLLLKSNPSLFVFHCVDLRGHSPQSAGVLTARNR